MLMINESFVLVTSLSLSVSQTDAAALQTAAI